jgi:hypothetical protein
VKTCRSDACRIVALAAVVVCYTLTGCGSNPVVVPTTYDAYNAKDGTFACEYPKGWTAEGGGKNGPQWATFASGPAEIRVSADVAGSLLGDIAGGFIPGKQDLPPELQPVQKVHEGDKQAAEQKFGGYQEVGTPQVLVVPLGPARKSEFTASSAFGSGLHGYRVTILGHDKRVVVYAVCPEADWPTLQAGFDHVLSSLRRGVPQ